MDFRQNQIDFLKSHYNIRLVEEAVKYADREIDQGIHTMFNRKWIELIKEEAEKLGSEDIVDYIDCLSKDNTTSIFSMLTFAYIYGMVNGVNNSNINTSPNPSSEYVLNKDFSFYFEFEDNDFGGYIEQAAKKFCNEYNDLLRNIELYGDCDRMVKYYKKDLEFMENPENIINLMKGLFIGEYMSGMVDRCWMGTKEDYTNRLQNATRYIDYLGFDKLESWKFGTWKEINDVGLVRYRNMQTDEEYERANGDFSKYWLNGETLIVKMVDGELKVVRS